MRLHSSTVFAVSSRVLRPALQPVIDLTRRRVRARASLVTSKTMFRPGVALLVAFAACGLRAETSYSAILTVSRGQCIWRAGDNPVWAAPSLDESLWQPYTQWKLNVNEPRIWVRCHTDLGALRGTAHLALEASAPAAYELYLNGEPIGRAGDLRSGNFSLDTIQAFPAPPSLLASPRLTLAARITYGYPDFSGYMEASPFSIRAGDQQVLDALHAATVLQRIHTSLNYAVCFAILGVLAFVPFGLFFFDRSRRDLLLLGIYSLGLAVIYMARFLSTTLASYLVSVDLTIYSVSAATVILVRTWIAFVLAGRRMPLLFWFLIGVVILQYAEAACGSLLPLSWSLPLAVGAEWTNRASYYASLACAVAPYVAFWPYTRIPRPTIPIAAVCMVWGALMLVFFASGAASFSGHISNLAALMVSAQLFVSLCVIVILIGLLFRDQQRTAQDRAELAGEMASAREIQHYFIPEKLPATPGLAIQSVYLPAREVGGDFFQVLPDVRDGSTLIVVGDVAGKGLKAGMLSALIVGAIRTASQFTREPNEILALLNQRLQGRGLVTCLAMLIGSGGSVELANAGHLPPYLNGEELAVEGSLPLGAIARGVFGAARFQLVEGDSLLLVSDGIVEAQNQRGELFGFERTRAISNQSAEAIARAAQAYGQGDDITVLTLTRIAVGAKSGNELGATALSPVAGVMK